MEALPPTIVDYLQALTSQSRSPAWLRVDPTGKISECGGAISEYGLGSLRPGDLLTLHLEFLDGMLPLEGVPVTLPCVTTDSTGRADVHLIPGTGGDWVLLLDSTEEAMRRQLLQQQLNELAILQEREAKALARLSTEKEKSERLLLSLFPRMIAEQLKSDTPPCIAEEYSLVTILFADIHDFWRIAGSLPPPKFIALLNEVFSLFDRLADSHGVQKIKTIGDSYMAVAGLPEPRADHAEAMAEMALSMQREIVGLRTVSPKPFSLRIGIHSGSVMAGVVGIRRLAYDLWGPTVNLANQMESSGRPGCIQVSSASHALLETKYIFEPRGEFYVKGQGAVATYLLSGRRPR